MELKLVEDMKSQEWRTLASKPEFKLDEFYDYLSKYNNYFNDNYGIRNILYSINARIKYLYFHKSPLPNKVILGRNNWLFLSPDMDVTISDRIDYLDDKFYKILEDSLVSKTVQFKNLGIKYLVILTPEKSYTYGELLPDNFNGVRTKARFDTLIQRLKSNPNLHIISLNEALLEAKKKDTIGLQYDTHWNGIGAFAAYKHMMLELKKVYPNVPLRNANDYEKKCVVYKWGDLANQIGIAEFISAKECKFNYIGKGAIEDTTLLSVKSTLSYSYTNKANEDMLDVLFLHDSYGASFLPWMINDFHSLHSLRMENFSFNPASFTQAGPKVIIHQMVPRHTPMFGLLSNGH
ncbi:MAG: hypothetical protein H7329_08320 [Opitutaceae bacterium]|nr:hypothetical protein [Cytophagales bacterium]